MWGEVGCAHRQPFIDTGNVHAGVLRPRSILNQCRGKNSKTVFANTRKRRGPDDSTGPTRIRTLVECPAESGGKQRLPTDLLDRHVNPRSLLSWMSCRGTGLPDRPDRGRVEKMDSECQCEEYWTTCCREPRGAVPNSPDLICAGLTGCERKRVCRY